jgi:hypothetical protein
LAELSIDLKRPGWIAGSKGWSQQIPAGEQAERAKVAKIDELRSGLIVAFPPQPKKRIADRRCRWMWR